MRVDDIKKDSYSETVCRVDELLQLFRGTVPGASRKEASDLVSERYRKEARCEISFLCFLALQTYRRNMRVP